MTRKTFFASRTFAMRGLKMTKEESKESKELIREERVKLAIKKVAEAHKAVIKSLAKK